ncbi:MAG: DUF2007 domain-containing protein [bacterium]
MICPNCGTSYRPGIVECADCGVTLMRPDEYEKLKDLAEREEEDLRRMKVVEVYTCQGEVEAGLVRSVLGASGIESFTGGNATQSVHPFTMDGMGQIKIMVRASEEDEARAVISEYMDEGDD